MKPNFWLLKVEKLLHTGDPSLKKESGNTKRNEIERLKIKFFFETDQLRGGFIPLFFYFYKKRNY